MRIEHFTIQLWRATTSHRSHMFWPIHLVNGTLPIRFWFVCRKNLRVCYGQVPKREGASAYQIERQFTDVQLINRSPYSWMSDGKVGVKLLLRMVWMESIWIVGRFVEGQFCCGFFYGKMVTQGDGIAGGSFSVRVVLMMCYRFITVSRTCYDKGMGLRYVGKPTQK